MIRRFAPIVTASAIALVLVAVPALAGSSFTAGAEAEADSDHGLELTITEPDGEDYGDTSRVTVVPPSSFTVVSCQQEPSWDCAADAEAGRVTFTRTALGVLGDNTLQFTVHTPEVNGTYTFRVTQADGAEEPSTVRSAPKVTVTGGKDPQPPPPDDGGSADDDGGTGGDTAGSDAGSSDDGGTTDDAGDDAGDGSSTSTGEAATDDGPTTDRGGTTSTDDTSSDTRSGGDDAGSDDSGSMAPRRTEGRSNGTRLEISPGRTAAEDLSLSAPDVADDPAIAPPSDGDQEQDRDTGPATMTAIAGQADDESDPGGLPWQQLLGGALLVAGGAVLAVRRWDLLARLRDWDPLDRVRPWRSS